MLRERKQREEKKTVEKCFPFTHSPIPHKFSTLSAVFFIQNTFYPFFLGGEKKTAVFAIIFSKMLSFTKPKKKIFIRFLRVDNKKKTAEWCYGI